MKKIGFIGCGNMGEAMLKGALDAGWVVSEEVVVHTRRETHQKALCERYAVKGVASNLEVAKAARILILAVKPDLYAQVLEEIRPVLTQRHIVVAISPAFSVAKVRRASDRPDLKVVRAMPNTPAMVGAGMTGVTFSTGLSEEEKGEIHSLLSSFGDAAEVSEEKMAAVGSVSGSAPAFVYMMIEALAQGAIRLGLPAQLATAFAAKTVEGAARMVMETGQHPAQLRDNVCSPGGTTIAGVASLEQKGFGGLVIEAMEVTAERFHEMEG